MDQYQSMGSIKDRMDSIDFASRIADQWESIIGTLR